MLKSLFIIGIFVVLKISINIVVYVLDERIQNI